MNTQKQNADIEWENLHICDDLRSIHDFMGNGRNREILDAAIRYIAFLRGRVDLHVPTIAAPLGLDGKVQDDWLLEMVKERIESLRDEVRHHEQQAREADKLLHTFCNLHTITTR